MNYCIIPARGGSKRIPRKNIKVFHGKPLICWPIKAAIESKCFDQIVVSTDDEEIANISRKAGATVPFLRPAELANDFSGSRDVITHAIRELDIQPNDVVCCLNGNAAFAQQTDISEAFTILEQSIKGTSVFAATSFEFPIQRAIKLDKNGYSSCIDESMYNQRSQDLEEYYHDAGQFMLSTADIWLKENNMFNVGRPLIIPRWRNQDIDSIEDWKQAELLFASINTK